MLRHGPHSSLSQRSYQRCNGAIPGASLAPALHTAHPTCPWPQEATSGSSAPQRLRQDSAQPRRVVAHAAPPGSPAAVAQVLAEVEAPRTTTAPPVLPSVREITPEFFYSTALDPQEPGIVVVDFYASWCGPCTIMLRELEKLQAAFPKVRFYKLNCSSYSADFASTLRVRSLPTIKVYHRGRFLDEVTGAKPVQLRQLLAHFTILVN